MAKWVGNIGYKTTVEYEAGLWEEQTTTRRYVGDVIRNVRKTQSSDKMNDGINISVQISIVADPFANQNIFAMRYLEYMGSRWEITDIEPQYPRLIISIGGLYNGQ